MKQIIVEKPVSCKNCGEFFTCREISGDCSMSQRQILSTQETRTLSKAIDFALGNPVSFAETDKASLTKIKELLTK